MNFWIFFGAKIYGKFARQTWGLKSVNFCEFTTKFTEIFYPILEKNSF